MLFRAQKRSFKKAQKNFKKSPKKRHFSKWLVHGVCQKIEYFINVVYFAN